LFAKRPLPGVLSVIIVHCGLCIVDCSAAEPCYDCKESQITSDPLGNIINLPKVQQIDWNWMAGVIGMGPGSRLRLINLNVGGFAYKESYTYSPATPYRSIGVGLSIFPTFNLAPNARVSRAA
jgi:hypothetical protein